MKFKAKVLPYYGNYGNWQSSAFDFPQINWHKVEDPSKT